MVFYSVVLSFVLSIACLSTAEQVQLIEANHPDIQYTGRIDFSNPRSPKFWQPGVYVKFSFKGNFCSVLIEDQLVAPDMHNYVMIIVDDQQPVRVKLAAKTNTIPVGENLSNGNHTVILSKASEAGNGFIEFKGVLTKEITASKPKPKRKLEFFGDSITCGMGSDESLVPCGKDKWHDQHNPFMGYAAITARNVNAQYHLSSVSGIGMFKSCCNMTVTMPQVFDKINMRDDQVLWDFDQYKPDLVTICLGQNDGVQDSLSFTKTYTQFVQTLRSKYPEASVVCMTSPMASKKLDRALRNYITGIVQRLNAGGDKNVYKFFISKTYNGGCGGHPNISEHQQIATELTAYLKKTFAW